MTFYGLSGQYGINKESSTSISDSFKSTDASDGCRKLSELKDGGLISEDEEHMRKGLIMQYMEFQQSDDDDEQQSLTISQMMSTVYNMFYDCFEQISTTLFSNNDRF